MALINNKSTVLIATFSPWIKGKRLPMNGNIEPLLDFFVPKVKQVILIDQPIPGSDRIMPLVETYKKGKKVKIESKIKVLFFLYPFLRPVKKMGTYFSFKIRDFLSVIITGFSCKTTFDLFIGVESINTIAGIFLRRLGMVKKVVYYVFEYSPDRYKQKWFNSLYLWLDRFCVYHADFVWDVSDEYQKVRIKSGLNPEKAAPVLHIPIGLSPEQIVNGASNKIIPFSLVFMGTLGPENGPDIAIRAFFLVLKKFPQSTLHIIGDGMQMEKLMALIKELKLDQKIILHGYILDRVAVSKTIKNFQIALAPYRFTPGAPRLYGYSIKIQIYLAAGLPVITTYVPPLGKVAAQKGAAIQVADNPKEFAKAIIDVFSNKKLCSSLRKKAIEFKDLFTWDEVFSNAIKKIA